MSSAKHIYAELFKTAAASLEAKSAKERALGRKEAGLDPALLKRLALVGSLGLAAGGGVLAGRHLLPRDPSEEEALESIGITEPGDYSVGVSPDVFGAESGSALWPEPSYGEGS